VPEAGCRVLEPPAALSPDLTGGQNHVPNRNDRAKSSRSRSGAVPAEIAALKGRALLDGITDLLVRYLRPGPR